jgi:23S rRNA-/tRNA-specific pseudouridylate synthase
MAAVKENGSTSTAADEDYVVVSKDDLWKDALEKEVGGATVQLVGLDDQAHHTAYARVSEGGENVNIGAVVECMVDEGWRRVVKDIMEKKEHVEKDTHPSASLLLRLGSVWLLNETAWQKGEGSHAHRVTPDEEMTVPDWQNFTLRVHYVPDRFFVAETVDWSKPCRGLLVGPTTIVKIGEETPHVPVLEGLPDTKDGVIVYEVCLENSRVYLCFIMHVFTFDFCCESQDAAHGFSIVNKPGAMPDHATISNHAEDVVACFRHALEERKGTTSVHVAVQQRRDGCLDTATSGLLAIATKAAFTTYMNKLLNKQQVTRHFKALVCVKDTGTLSKLEHFQSSGTIVTHYLDPKSPTPKHFYRHKPKDSKKEFLECKMRIVKIGDDNFRAACVRSVYKDSVDSSLAHRLWGPDSATPAEDLGVQYVMEVEVELLTARAQQIHGQLAALGCPIVGDFQYGGGRCEFHSQHHKWNRLALQCCELSFQEPQWKDKNHKKELVSSERKCFFRLNMGWWSEYLTQYELYHQSY